MNRKIKLNRSIDIIVQECALHWLNIVRLRREKRNKHYSYYDSSSSSQKQKIIIPHIPLAHIPPRKLAPELKIDLIPENFDRFISLNEFLTPSVSNVSSISKEIKQYDNNNDYNNGNNSINSIQYPQEYINHIITNKDLLSLDNNNDKNNNDNNNITIDDDILLIEKEIDELSFKLTDKTFSNNLTILERKQLSIQLKYYADLLQDLSNLKSIF